MSAGPEWLLHSEGPLVAVSDGRINGKQGPTRLNLKSPGPDCSSGTLCGIGKDGSAIDKLPGKSGQDQAEWCHACSGMQWTAQQVGITLDKALCCYGILRHAIGKKLTLYQL